MFIVEVCMLVYMYTTDIVESSDLNSTCVMNKNVLCAK